MIIAALGTWLLLFDLHLRAFPWPGKLAIFLAIFALIRGCCGACSGHRGRAAVAAAAAGAAGRPVERHLSGALAPLLRRLTSAWPLPPGHCPPWR